MQSPPWANLVREGTLLGRPADVNPSMVAEGTLMRRPTGPIPSMSKLSQRGNSTKAPTWYNPLPVLTLTLCRAYVRT